MTDYNETFFGDLSDDPNDPTNHEFYPSELVLFNGSNVVTGSTVGGGNPPGDRDFFTFEVPAGFTVSAIILNDYQWGNGNQSDPGYGDSYFAVTEGSSFPSLTDASNFLVSKLIDDYAAEGSEVGQDLLDPMVGNAAGPAGPGSLGPKVYSVWYQETGANTTYEFDIVLDAPAGADFGAIQFSSSNIQVNEGAGTFDITLTRTGGSDGGVSAVLRRTGGSAQLFTDFGFHPVAATFKHGETQKVFSYPIVDDALIEGNETVTFELVDPAGGATLGATRTSTLTIVDNDFSPTPGVIQFSSSDIQVNEAEGTADLILNRTGGSDGAVSVTLNQTGGTAENSVDYTVATPVTVNFADGETQKLVSVALVNDALVEGNETALFELTNPTGGASLGATTQTTLTIIDSDNLIRGTGGPETLLGGTEDDKIFGRGGDDRLVGYEGNDRLFGGSDDDRLIGWEGDDRLLGGSGDDLSRGGDGNDRLLSGSGDDVLDSGLGADTLVGGAGRDKFVLKRRHGSDLIRDFQIDEDSLDLRGNLRFGRLTITQEGNKAVIAVGNDQLAVLKGVQVEQLTASQFG